MQLVLYGLVPLLNMSHLNLIQDRLFTLHRIDGDKGCWNFSLNYLMSQIEHECLFNEEVLQLTSLKYL